MTFIIGGITDCGMEDDGEGVGLVQFSKSFTEFLLKSLNFLVVLSLQQGLVL